MKENVHQSIIHSNIYKSAQKNYKQPTQLKCNNIHTKKEPHVRIMLLFKFFFFWFFFFLTLNLTYQKVEVFFFFFNLSPFCEYHHHLETTGASASQELLFSTKIFCKKEGKGGRTLPTKLESFWSRIQIGNKSCHQKLQMSRI